MLPFFNTSGPFIPGEHYMLPPQRRLHDVLELIEARRYFTLHAGRQTGKTTSAMWLEGHLNATGRWRAVWIDLQTAREKPDVARAMSAILTIVDDALADQIVRRDVQDRSVEITATHVDAAKETITEERGLDQVTRYLDHADLDEGWLVLFDLRSTLPWEQRLTTREVEHRGKRVHIVGC